MEPHQQMNEVDGGAGKSGGFLCRQSSSRWTPTTDQIRILKDLYYNNGVRSPSAEQIQRISARLRQYGKIEGKNVFYWFQNHKARERQKKRFTSDNHHHPSPIFAANPPGVSGPSSSSSVATAGHHVYTVGQGSTYAYGSHTHTHTHPHPHLMDKQSFIREGPILSGGGGWVGHYMDPYSSSLFDKRKVLMEENQEDQEQEEEEEVEVEAPEIETLPLFPTYAEDIKMNCSGGGWYRNSSAGNAASLELTLNSYSSYYNGKLPD